jgi:hypothetical protein
VFLLIKACDLLAASRAHEEGIIEVPNESSKNHAKILYRDESGKLQISDDMDEDFRTSSLLKAIYNDSKNEYQNSIEDEISLMTL